MFDWLKTLQTYKEKKEPVALVTVTKCLGSAPSFVSARMIVTTSGKTYGTIGGGKLEFKVIDEAIRVIRDNMIAEVEYTLGPQFEQCCGGKVELIIEPISRSPEVFIFGAGHIGVALCKLLYDTPFHICLIDSRQGWFEGLDLSADIKIKNVDEKDFKTFKNAVRWGDDCYVLVMTHDHRIDLDIIAMASSKATAYLGLIGSKTKCVRFDTILKNEFKIPSGMDNVTCPVGLDIGGETPKEIAISIAAELIKTYYATKLKKEIATNKKRTYEI